MRIARGMKQSEIAQAAGIALKTYGTLERGQRAAHADNLRKVLEVLGVPQVSDLDRYDEGTRAFIATTAPIFQNLPESARADAQMDVVMLLGGRLKRASAAEYNPIKSDGGGPGVQTGRHTVSNVTLGMMLTTLEVRHVAH